MNEPTLKRHYTPEEKEKYCAAFKESKLSAEAFCKASGISKATLYKWIKIGLEDSGLKPQSEAGFSPVLLKEGSVPEEECVCTELRFSSGAVLCLTLKENQLLSLITRMVQ